MAYRNSPRVITDGLVFAVDASNQISYVSGSLTWFDLCRTPFTGSITASLTDRGLFFNGSSQQVNFSQNTLASNNFTINVWCNPAKTVTVVAEANTGITGIGGQGYVVGPMQSGANSGAGFSMGTNCVNVFEHGNSYLPALLVYQSTFNTFTNVCVVYVNKQPTLYINGVKVRTGVTSVQPTVFLTLDVFGQEQVYGFYSGSITNVYMYSRSLSDTEVYTNYNALKGRFGVSP